MSFEAPSVPFTTEAYEGFATTEGLLRLEANRIILEFKTKDSFVGLIQSEVKEVAIPLSDVTEIEFKSKLFSNKLHIRSNSMQMLDKIPGSKQGIAILNIRRQDRDLAKRLVSSISLLLSENRLKRLDDEWERLP